MSAYSYDANIAKPMTNSLPFFDSYFSWFWLVTTDNSTITLNPFFSTPVYALGGNDKVIGNEGNNLLDGGADDDFLIGAGGDDILIGGTGNDKIDGGAGVDNMNGGDGNDLFLIDSQEDHYEPDLDPLGFLFSENINGGAGTDRLWYSGDGLFTVGPNVTNVELVELKRVADSHANSATPGDGSDGEMTTTESGILAFLMNNGATLNGNDQANVIVGSASGDVINGYGGTDILIGLFGSDEINGGGDTDIILGDLPSTDDIEAVAALLGFSDPLLDQALDLIDDLFDPTPGDNTLNGEDGLDILIGGQGNDALNGGADTDILLAGTGTNTLDGGEGLDIAIYTLAGSPVTANLTTGAATTANGDTTDTLSNIEVLVGSNFADNLTGGPGDLNLLIGLDGDDTMTGGTAASLVLIGAQGNDTLNAGGANLSLMLGDGLVLDDLLGTVGGLLPGVGSDLVDQIDGLLEPLEGVADLLALGEGNDIMTGGAGLDVMLGGAGNDNMDGAGGTDILLGGTGDDTAMGGAGLDILLGGTGTNTLDGGGDLDIVLYSGATSGVTANLAAGTATTANSDTTDSLSNFEILIGSNFVDDLTGTNSGAVGVVLGLDGDDMVTGGNLSDSLLDIGFNVLAGDGGNDTVTAGAATLNLMFGDALELGAATDAVVDIISGVPAIGGLIGDLVEDALEGLTGALDGLDDLFGAGSGNDHLIGSGGIDALFGGAGADLLDGGRGADLLTGGEGADIFAFAPGDTDIPDDGRVCLPFVGCRDLNWVPPSSPTEAIVGNILNRQGPMDVIRDFEDGVDKIDVSAFGAGLVFDGYDSTSNKPPSGNSREVHVVKARGSNNDAIVYINSNTSGDSSRYGKYEAAIYVEGGASVTWDATDFLFVAPVV